MHDFIFDPDAWGEYVYWQTQDRKTLDKINKLLKSIARDGVMQGIGKPEPLKYRPGYSRRIDDANRLVYDVDEAGNIRIISCRGHY